MLWELIKIKHKSFLIFIVIFLLGAVSAQSVPDPNLQEINGVTFDVPYGSNLNDTLSYDNYTVMDTGKVLVSHRVYINELNETTEIDVVGYDDYQNSHEALDKIDGETTDIKGVEGKLINSTDSYTFVFVSNGNLVNVTAKDYILMTFFVYNS